MKEPFAKSTASSSIFTEMDIEKFIVEWLVTNFIPLKRKTTSNEIWRNLFVETKMKGSLEFNDYQQVKNLFNTKLISHLNEPRFALTLTQIEQLQYGKWLDLKNVRVKFFSKNQKGYISDLSTSDLNEVKAIVEYTRLDEFSESCLLALKSLSKLNYMINVDDVHLDLCAIVKRKLVNTTKQNESFITNHLSVMPSSSQNSFKNTDIKSAQLELERTDRGVNIIVTGDIIIRGLPDRCRIKISSDRIEDDFHALDATVNQLSSMAIQDDFNVIRSRNGETQIIDLFVKNYKISNIGKACHIFIPADTNNNKIQIQNRTTVSSNHQFLIDSEPDSPSFPVECNIESQLPYTAFNPPNFSTQFSTDLPLPVAMEPNNLQDLSIQNKDGFSSAKRPLESSDSGVLPSKRKMSDIFETSSTSTSTSASTVINNVPSINKPAPLSVKLKRFSKSVLSDKDSFHDAFERVLQILVESDQKAAERQRSQNITVSRSTSNEMFDESEVDSLKSDKDDEFDFDELNDDESDSVMLSEIFSKALGDLNEVYGGEPTVAGLFLSGLLDQAHTGQLNNPQQKEVDDNVHNNTENSTSSEESGASLM